jgi:hypothetical protein
MTILSGACLIALLTAAPPQQLLASNLVRVYGDDNSDTRAVFAEPVRMPANVTIADGYAGVIEAMLRSSPTFRSQCSRIGQARHLHLKIQMALLAPRHAAATRLMREPDGRLGAEVQISPFGDAVVLIAHEFEHVIEQLDGVDLPAMADRPGTGVRTDPESGEFETERAISVGQRVAREVSRDASRR